MEEEEEDGPKKGGPKPALLAKVEAINKWSAGTANLSQDLARELRAIVREALLARLDWFDPVIKEPDTETLKKALPVTCARCLDRSRRREPGNADPVLAVPRNARMGQMFTGLVLLDGGFPERAGEALPRLDALVTPAVPELRGRIVAVLEADDASLRTQRPRSWQGPAGADGFPAAPKDVDLLNALLWIPEAGHQRADAAARRPEWTDAYTAYANAGSRR